MTDVAGGLITLEYALDGLNFKPKTYEPGDPLSARDADIARYIRAATPVVEDVGGSAVLQTTKTQRFGGGKSAILLNDRIANEEAVTAVRVDGTTITGCIVDVDAGMIYAPVGTKFNAGILNVEVDLTVGYQPVPEALQMAARVIVVALYQATKQRQLPQFDSDTAGEGIGIPDDFIIPRAARQLCAPFRTGGYA